MPRKNNNATKGLRARQRRTGKSKRKGRDPNDAPMTNISGHPFRRLR